MKTLKVHIINLSQDVLDTNTNWFIIAIEFYWNKMHAHFDIK